MGKVNLPATADEMIRQLTARVAALEAAAQTRAPLDRVTGGPFAAQDAAGNTVLYAGAMAPNWTGTPTAQYGTELYREAGANLPGAVALSLSTPTGTAPQVLAHWDTSGDIVVQDDASGQGLARPYLEIALGRADTGNWPANTSTAYTDMFAGTPYHQHPKINASGRCVVTTGATASIQLASGATVIGTPVTITGSTGTLQPWSIGPATWAGAHLAPTDLRLQTKIASGTGTITVMISTLTGQQT